MELSTASHKPVYRHSARAAKVTIQGSLVRLGFLFALPVPQTRAPTTFQGCLHCAAVPYLARRARWVGIAIIALFVLWCPDTQLQSFRWPMEVLLSLRVRTSSRRTLLGTLEQCHQSREGNRAGFTLESKPNMRELWYTRSVTWAAVHHTHLSSLDRSCTQARDAEEVAKSNI